MGSHLGRTPAHRRGRQRLGYRRSSAAVLEASRAVPSGCPIHHCSHTRTLLLSVEGRKLPINVDPLDSKPRDRSRHRWPHTFERAWARRSATSFVGRSRPVRTQAGPAALVPRLETDVLIPAIRKWDTVSARIFPWTKPEILLLRPDPFAERSPSGKAGAASYLFRCLLFRPSRSGRGQNPNRRRRANRRPGSHAPPGWKRARASCRLHPPVEYLQDYLDLTPHRIRAHLKMPVLMEGYAPPWDPGLPFESDARSRRHRSQHPSGRRLGRAYGKHHLAIRTRAPKRLGTEKFMLTDSHSGTGGGNHVSSAAQLPRTVPSSGAPICCEA